MVSRRRVSRTARGLRKRRKKRAGGGKRVAGAKRSVHKKRIRLGRLALEER